MEKNLNVLVIASLLAAITTIATIVIRIPIFATNGYINIGDAIVLLSAWFLGNPYGALAAGIGSGGSSCRIPGLHSRNNCYKVSYGVHLGCDL